MKKAYLVYILLLCTLPVKGGVLEHANLLYSQGKLVESIPLYKQAALEGANPALCYFNCANAYFQLDSIPQSIVYYRATLTYAPDFFRGHLNLAIAYYTLDDIGETIATLHRALEIEPNDEKSNMVLGAAYRKAGAIPQAIITFERLITINPEKEDAFIALGEMYRELEDNGEAIKWLSRYPDAGPNKSYVFLLLADIYDSEKQPERSIFYLRQSFESDMGNKWTAYRLVVKQYEIGNNLLALDEAERRLEQFTTFAELALLAGNIAFEINDLNRAERLYTKARNNGSGAAIIGLENIRQKRLSEEL